MEAKVSQNGDGFFGSSGIEQEPNWRETEQINTGNSLLSFMTLASGNVKTAMEKPATFKRNINHRRYLQKQLRNYAKKKSDNPPKKNMVSRMKTDKGSYKLQNLSVLKSMHSSWKSERTSRKASKLADVSTEEEKKQRGALQTFWQEPLFADFNQSYVSTYSLHQMQTRGTMDDSFNSPAFENALVGNWNDYETRDYSSESSKTESVPSISSDDGSCEEFMTGEELTRNIDIKDLYVPEMYCSEKGYSDSQENMYIPPISPTHYILSPTQCTEQGYFHFEHDPQGLPSFARAFLSPGSCAHFYE